MRPRERAWVLFEQNRERVVAARKEGRCDGILPAARTLFDDLPDFCNRQQSGLLPPFDRFPDRRERRSIASFFFCHTLPYRPLFRIPRLGQIGDTLFPRLSPFAFRAVFPTRRRRQFTVGFLQVEAQ